MKKEKVKVGLIGLGNRGRGILRTILACGESEVVALCDVYEDRLQGGCDIVVEKRGNKPNLYLDYMDFLFLFLRF